LTPAQLAAAKTKLAALTTKPLGQPSETEGGWVLATTNLGTGPLLVRFNASVRAGAPNPEFPLRLAFTIPLANKNPGGLPDPQENDALATVEDVIRRRVGASSSGVHVLTVTNGEMKELVFYVTREADIGSIHKSIVDDVATHQVQRQAVMDPNWEIYFEFAPPID